jgi:hypothetical protein
MVDADAAKQLTADGAVWDAWQRAAVEYWLLQHPELGRFRRGDPLATPTVTEFHARADQVVNALGGVPPTWRLASPSPERAEHLARVGWFHELLAGLYEPIESSIQRAGTDPDARETLVRFLEADVYCDRSGYVKADVIRALTRIELDVRTTGRLRSVVLDIVDGVDRREFRSYVRLARRVDGDELRAPLRDRLGSGKSRTARHARWVLEGLGDEAVRR